MTQKRVQPVFKLKKPFIVWGLACCFILALPANLAMALRNVSSSFEWYIPSNWIRLFFLLSVVDQVVLGLLPIAGVLLLIQRKTSWLFAIITLVAVTVFNLWVFLARGLSGQQILMLSAINAAMFTVFYFFRYPYLDKRDQIFHGVAERYQVLMPILVGEKKAHIKNISETGAFIEMASMIETPRPGARVFVSLPDRVIEVEVIHHRNAGCGIRFISPKRLSSGEIAAYQKKYQN